MVALGARATPKGASSSKRVDGRPTRRVGRSRGSTTPDGRRSRCAVRWAPSPSPASRPAHPHRRSLVRPVLGAHAADGAVVADFGAVYAARPARDASTTGWTAGPFPCTWATCSIPTGQVSTTARTQETNLSFSYITRAGEQTFEALTYLGFRYLQIDNPRRGDPTPTRCGPSPPTPPCPTCRGHVQYPGPHARTRCGNSMLARVSTAPTSSSSTRRHARRDSSSGTRPTSPRRSCAPTATRT